MTPSISARECRFVVHVPSYDPERPDLHIVKERLHYADGSTGVRLHYIKDYQRPFWVTKKAYRDHTQKKEWEQMDKLDSYHCTQSQLRNKLAQVLDKPWSRDSARQLCNSPYVYGADIPASSLIKKQYRDKWPDVNTPYSVATFDVETDMLGPIQTIIMATITFENKVFTAVQASFVKGIAEPTQQIEAMTRKYIGEYVDRHSLACESVICDDEISVVKAAFAKLHEWKPDWLSIWNLDFDVSRLIEACERAGVDPASIFSDPDVPAAYRVFKYKQGKKKRISTSGKVTPIKPAAQWHIVHCTSSFWWIDAMCVYKQIRLGKQEERSYSLDAILNKVLGIRKLTFAEADKYKGPAKHQFMQQYYPLEYIVYNRFDSWSMQELDMKTKDVAVTLPVFAENSGFDIFDSQPKQIAVALYFECLEQNLVIGTVGSSNSIVPREKAYENNIESDELIDEEEDDVLSLRGWIATLKAINKLENGICLIEEMPDHPTNISLLVFDSDSTAAYPSATIVANVSKETTKCEIIDIIGIDEDVFRLANINLLSGPPNAIQYCTTMFGFPSVTEMLALYQVEKNN
jgi:hypothetical protein